jgi:hypothetical protein
MSFVHAAGTRQHSLCWVQVPYVTVSDLRLPFSSPPTTRRVTVQVFDSASTQGLSARKELIFNYDLLHKAVSNSEAIVV